MKTEWLAMGSPALRCGREHGAAVACWTAVDSREGYGRGACDSGAARMAYESYRDGVPHAGRGAGYDDFCQ